MTKTTKNLSKSRMALQAIADNLEWLGDRSYHGLRASNAADYKIWQQYNDWKHERYLFYRLKKQKLIEAKKIGDRLFLRLTEKGTTQALRDRMLSIKQKNPNGACLVIFDIPESERHARDLFRRFLRESNFKKLQQSVWYTDKDVSAFILAFIKQNGLAPWIKVIVGKIIN